MATFKYRIEKFTLEMTLLASLAVLPVESGAIDAKGIFITRGIGSDRGSCGDYVRAEAEVRRWYESWLMGYISGVNSAKNGKDDYSNGINSNGLTQWVENYCKRNPLDSFSVAVDELLLDINKK